MKTNILLGDENIAIIEKNWGARFNQLGDIESLLKYLIRILKLFCLMIQHIGKEF